MVQRTRNVSLDWMALVDATEEAYHWLQALLRTGEATIQLQPRSEQEQQLWHFFNEQRSALRLEGRRVLFFTYPYVVEAVGEEWQRIPLLRWPCTLEPPVTGRSHWVLQTIRPGIGEMQEGFVARLVKDHPGEWRTKLQKVLTPSEDALLELGSFAQALTENTPYHSSSWQPALARMPQVDMTTMTQTPELWWSAGLGLDYTAWPALGDLPSHWHQPFTHEESAIGDLPLSRLSPGQYAFAKQVFGQRYALAEGHPDGGFNTISLELVKLALAQGKSCLIVARKKAVLENLSKQFQELKTPEGYSLLWQNEYTDLPIVQGMLASAEKQKAISSSYDPLRWRTALNRSNRLQRQYDAWYEASRKKIFGQQSWSDLLGFYLHYARGEGKELLASQLNSAHFAFVPEEFREIDAALQITRPLYQDLGTLHHPLSNLSAAIFIHQDLAESRTFIQQTSQEFLQRGRKLHQRFVRSQSQYADQLAARQEEQYLRLRTLLDILEQRHEDSQNTYGSDTLRSGDLTLKLYSRFSKKYAQALNEKSTLQQIYQELYNLHQELDPFPYEWLTPKPNRIVDGLDTFMRTYRQGLDGWRGQLFQGVQAEMVRLNAKTAFPELEAAASIETLEQDLEVFIDELNGSGLYQLPLQSKTLTMNRQQKYLEDIIDQLEQSQEGLLQYEAFYHWQRNWFSLSEISRKTIQALLRSRPEDWEAAFASWYFNECLQRHYTPFSPFLARTEEQYVQEVEQLRAQLPGFLQEEWAARRHRAYQRLRSALRPWPGQLSDLMANYGESLVDYFPVSFANPEVAAQLASHYDLVILEKSQELSLPQTAPILLAAKQVAVIAQTNQLALTENGIVDFLKQGGIPTVYCADDPVPNLAEYWNRRQPKVHFHQVDGRFSETERINEVEAQELLKLLNSIEPQGSKTFPKVGILTLTQAQRDHIRQLLFRIKKERSAGAELVQQLERNGLTIIHAGEALGQQFEVVIYSPVYGPVDHKGHLTKLLPTLNQPRTLATLRLVEELLARAQTIHLLNSLPLDEVEVRQAWSNRRGEQLHAFVIGLAHAYTEGDYGSLAFLHSNWPSEETEIEITDALPQELIYRLRALVSGWKWQFTHVQGIKEKVILAKSPDSIHVVLLPDGFVARTRSTTLDWENWQQDRLRLSGYQVLPFSSEDLWKNPGLTCHRLAGQLRGLAFGEEE